MCDTVSQLAVIFRLCISTSTRHSSGSFEYYATMIVFDIATICLLSYHRVSASHAYSTCIHLLGLEFFSSTCKRIADCLWLHSFSHRPPPCCLLYLWPLRVASSLVFMTHTISQCRWDGQGALACRQLDSRTNSVSSHCCFCASVRL